MIFSPKSRVLNLHAATNQRVQHYKQQVLEKAQKDIEKIEHEVQQLEQVQ